jgi:hypothetical protein
MNQDLHRDHAICEETLQALAYSRFNLLIKKRVNPQAARLIAMIEIDKRRELAKRVGADEALLARFEWKDSGILGVSMRLVLDELPDDFEDRFISEFEPLPRRSDIDEIEELLS